MSKKEKELTEIYVVQNRKGDILSDTARATEELCIDGFVKGWISPVIRDHISRYEIKSVWDAYERAGFKMTCIQLNQ